jgi:hypothetical protein
VRARRQALRRQDDRRRRKWAYRTADGREVLRDEPGGTGRALQEPLPAREDLAARRAHCAEALPPCPTTPPARRRRPAWTAEKEAS